MTTKYVYLVYWQFGNNTRGSVKYPMRVIDQIRIAKAVTEAYNQKALLTNKWYFIMKLPFDDVPITQRLLDFFIWEEKGKDGYEGSLETMKGSRDYYRLQSDYNYNTNKKLKRQIRALGGRPET